LKYLKVIEQNLLHIPINLYIHFFWKLLLPIKYVTKPLYILYSWKNNKTWHSQINSTRRKQNQIVVHSYMHLKNQIYMYSYIHTCIQLEFSNVQTCVQKLKVSFDIQKRLKIQMSCIHSSIFIKIPIKPDSCSNYIYWRMGSTSYLYFNSQQF